MSDQNKRSIALCERISLLMGWEPRTACRWSAIRKVAVDEAVAISLDRLEQIADLVAACHEFRDAVLYGRHQLEEPCLDGDQTNAVLEVVRQVW